MMRDDEPINVLLVDDQPSSLTALEAVLDGLDLRVVKAASGEQALRQLLDQDFAVVLMDVQMQGLDGFATAQLIRGRDRSRTTPIIFLTAFESPAFPIARAYTLGAVDYLLKPVAPVVLRSKVAVFVDLFRKTRQVERQAELLRRAEREELRVTRARLAAIVESSEDAIIGKSLDAVITDWNRGAERLYGWTAAEAVGKPVSILLPADGADELPVIMEHVRRGEPMPAHETVRRHKDGRRIDVAVSVSPIRDAAGEVIGASTIARDISERKRSDEERARLYNELREADRRKDDFLAMLAHELRNPLAPIVTGLHILRRPSTEGQALGQVRDMLERQVRHLVRLVDDLLDVSRIARGKIHIQSERLDLARLVRTTAADVRPLIDRAGLGVTVETPETPVWVRGDATRLSQVLTNLLDNAAKFTEAGGQVTVRLTSDEARRQAVLTVRDTGAGLEPELLPWLFTTFAQADRSLHRTRGGLGLGLALVKGLVELHGGEVGAASAGPGRGSEFTVRLPLVGEPAALTKQPADHAPAADKRRILVVEDNPDAAESLRMLLALLGHDVEVAKSGPEGVERAEAWHPDVVLCDIGLPGLDGYGVAEELRRNPDTAAARLIAITGYGQDEDRRRSQRAGFDHHLTKPVDPDTLLGLLAG